MKWLEETPLIGRWDWEFEAVGYGAAVSAQGTKVPREQLDMLEDDLDDGNASTGTFRRQGSRVSYVIKDE